MNVVIRTVLGIYHLALLVVLAVQFMAYWLGSEPLFHKNSLLLVNSCFSALLVFLGIRFLLGKQQRIVSRRVFLVALVAYLIWVLVVFASFRILGRESEELISVFFIPMIPNVIFNVWCYFNFEKLCYDYSHLKVGDATSYQDVIDLCLPFLMVLESRENYIRFKLSSPTRVYRIFKFGFLILWISAWIFGATMISIKTPFPGVFFYLPLIYIIRVFIKTCFSKIYITLSPNRIELREVPFERIIRGTKASDFEPIFGRFQALKGKGEYEGIAIGRHLDSEMIYVAHKLLVIHEYNSMKREASTASQAF